MIKFAAFVIISLFSFTSLAQNNPQVLFKTNHGDIIIELNPQAAPNTVNNFVDYVKGGFYKGTIFHRVIPSFMIQGGGFTKDMQQKTTNPPIAIESNNGLKNVIGTIAMARTMNPNSATSQFFINVKDNTFLNYQSAANPGYCVFGRVVSGMDVVSKIETVRTQDYQNHANVPSEPVIIEHASILPTQQRSQP